MSFSSTHDSTFWPSIIGRHMYQASSPQGANGAHPDRGLTDGASEKSVGEKLAISEGPVDGDICGLVVGQELQVAKIRREHCMSSRVVNVVAKVKALEQNLPPLPIMFWTSTSSTQIVPSLKHIKMKMSSESSGLQISTGSQTLRSTVGLAVGDDTGASTGTGVGHFPQVPPSCKNS